MLREGGGQSLLNLRDCLIASEMIPSFLLQIIRFLFWLDVLRSHSLVPLIISAATRCVLLLHLQLHIGKIHLCLVFICIREFILCCYLPIEKNVNKNLTLLAKYYTLMCDWGGEEGRLNRIWEILGLVLLQWKNMWDSLEIWHFHPNLVYTFKNFCFVNLPFNICYVFHLSSQMSKMQREPKSFLFGKL